MPPLTTVSGTNLYQRRDTTTYESDRLPSSVSAHVGDVIPPTPMQWHPKLTPHRGLTLVVGVGLCILKAVLVYKNVQVASITVEWVLGTLLVILLYVLDILERHLKETSVQLWFFNSDCMNIPWKLFKLLRITPPEYSTLEEPDWNRRIRPLVTNYRLLVSASVVVFGIVKAAFAYRELSNGANTLDWIFGAVVTTIIFFTGLYENDPTHQNHLLFDQDSSPKALVIGREGFLIATSFLIICIPVYTISLGQKLLRYYIDAFNEPFESKGAQDWHLHAFTCARYIFVIDIVLSVEYISLLVPIVSILILQRYFEPNSALSRCFSSLVRRYSSLQLQHLVPTPQTIDLISARFAQLISTSIALNKILMLTFGLVGTLAIFSAILELSLLLWTDASSIGIFIGILNLGGELPTGYLTILIMSSLRKSILAMGRPVGVGDTVSQVA